jgi:Bacterial TSP3 repeat
MRSQRGQTAAEYMGVLLVVSVIIAAVSTTNVGTAIARQLDRLVCEISEEKNCEAPPTRAGRPGDRDGDGVSDRDERRAGTDPRSDDTDADGIKDGDERRAGTDPLADDTDGDGIDDLREASSGGKLDPTKDDTDGDGLTDAEEVALGTDPSNADGDGEYGALRDGLTDAQEIALGTDPNAYDTDGDGNPDGYEVERGDDPTDDERNLITKGFETFVLDDPIGAIVTLGAGKLASGAAKVLAGRVRALTRALRGAKSVQEAAAIRRRILATIRDALKRPPKSKLTPAQRQKRIDELSHDPDRGGVSDNSILEATDAVQLEEAGHVKGLRRANGKQNSRENGADFVEADGRLWDHKRATQNKGRFDAEEFVGKIETNDIAQGERIMLNHKDLNVAEREALLRAIDARGLRDQFVFLPPL